MGSLTAYLREQRGKEFRFGYHDCLTFANGAWRGIYGRGVADDFEGVYQGARPKTFRKLMLEYFGTDTMHGFLNVRAQKVDGFPPRGAIVTAQNERDAFITDAMGIAMGEKAFFLAKFGLVAVPIEETEGAWICRS